jgi:hypothetical protein
MPPLPTIACKDCGHVNEGERVYCHNCGAKLDRAVLLTEQQQQQETAEDKQKRIKRMMNPNAGLFTGAWKSLLKAVAAGAVVAVFVNLARTPENIPPMPKKGEILDAPPLGMVLENVVLNPNPVAVSLKEDEINNYLKNTVRMKKDDSFMGSMLTFQRALVHLEPEICNITLQNGLWDYPTYMSIGYKLKIENHKIVGVPAKIRLGRLAVPVQAAPYIAPMFQPLWDAMHRERGLMDKLQGIQVGDGALTVSAGPQTAR